MTSPKTPDLKHEIKIVRRVASDVSESTPAPRKKDSFHKLSVAVSNRVGSPTAFVLAVLLIGTWLITGPLFGYSDTWQLVINTTTTIVTFLMVFIIQNSQNREARATQLKLNELIKSSKSARTEFVDLEELTDAELDTLAEQFKDIHETLRDRKAKQ